MVDLSADSWSAFFHCSLWFAGKIQRVIFAWNKRLEKISNFHIYFFYANQEKPEKFSASKEKCVKRNWNFNVQYK